MRVLIVEDERELAEAIAKGLQQDGIAADLAFDGHDALSQATAVAYDVIILDRDLPLLHGDEVCRTLVKRAARARILMLTAAASIDARVEGLGIGADDYLPKPFAFAELIARIRALGRRVNPALPPVLTHGDISLDSSQRIVRRGGRRVDLSPKELAVLEVLLGARGAVVSAEQLLERVWDGATDPFTQTVKVTVHRLRLKLGEPPVIVTVSQAGYRI